MRLKGPILSSRSQSSNVGGHGRKADRRRKSGRRLQSELGSPQKKCGPIPEGAFAVFVVLGSAVTLAMLGYVFVGLQYSAAAYAPG
jgi:hypothetical protein